MFKLAYPFPSNLDMCHVPHYFTASIFYAYVWDNFFKDKPFIQFIQVDLPIRCRIDVFRNNSSIIFPMRGTLLGSITSKLTIKKCLNEKKCCYDVAIS